MTRAQGSSKLTKGRPPSRPSGSEEQFDAFLSHSSRDKRLAVRLEKGLVRAGLRVWIDHANIRAGGLLLDALQQALVESRVLVLLWSEPASDSRWVAAEWQAAWHLEKGIIPCRLDATPLPPFLLRQRFCDFQQSYRSGFAELETALGGRQPKVPKTRSQPKLATRLGDVVQHLATGQQQVLESLGLGNLQTAARVQAGLNDPVRTALRRYPKSPLVLALAGYHQKNEFLLERDQGGRTDDRLLEEAERQFLAALSVRPDDPNALNGIGSVLILRGELDAAEFYVRRAIAQAQHEGGAYAAAQQDLHLIQRLKRNRDGDPRRFEN